MKWSRLFKLILAAATLVILLGGMSEVADCDPGDPDPQPSPPASRG